MTMPVTNVRNAFRTGSAPGSDIGTPVLVMKGAFDPTSATQIELFTLPKGAIPLNVYSLGGATGGSNPTVDIGTAGSNAGFANELDADAYSASGTGALTGVELTANTVVYGKVGASAATGGTTTILLSYVMSVGVVNSGTAA